MNTNKSTQLTKWLAGLTAFAALAGINSLHAQTWQTVLDYQLAAGQGGEGLGIAADTLGNVFSGGNGSDAAGIAHGITLKTDTTQGNWFVSDDTNPDPAQYQSNIWDFGIDAGRNLYSIGQLTPNSSGQSWYVRKSADSGLTWSTADLFQYTAGQAIDATGFAADDSGSVYVVGWGRDQTVVGSGKRATIQSYIHWLVRKSGDGGQTWRLVDDMQGATGGFGAYKAGFVAGAGVFVVGVPYTGGTGWMVRRSLTGEPGTWSTVDGPIASGSARGVANDNSGNIYVAGTQVITVTIKTRPLTTISYSAWVVRKSSDGGNTWQTVDTFTYAQNQSANANGIGRNSTGDVVVVGRASDSQGKLHWLARTPDSSGTWQTVDDFQLAAGYGAGAASVTADASGNLLVTGTAQDTTSREHWIVRRLAAPAP